MGQLRHSLENILIERESEVTIYDAAVIQSACRHEGRAQLLQRWLRELDNGDKSPSVQDRLSILREIGSATDARDKCLKSLRLHEKPEEDDSWPIIAVTNGPGVETETPERCQDDNTSLIDDDGVSPDDHDQPDER